jgi:hypothetical protein
MCLRLQRSTSVMLTKNRTWDQGIVRDSGESITENKSAFKEASVLSIRIASDDGARSALILTSVESK